jgi:uncharacterized RDD family membrane protein YckC
MSPNPYAPPQQEPPAPAAALESADTRRLASLGRRLGGAMIDGVVTLVLGSIVSHGMAALTGMERTVLFAQVCFLVPFAAQWALVAQRGQTFGKMILRTRIVFADGRLPGFFHGVVLRAWPVHLVGFLPALTSPALQPFTSLLLLADMLVIFAAGRRCLHDRFAGTLVVDVR